MKICLINHSFPPQIGGGETHMYLLARGFFERGHEVTVVTGGNGMFLEDENDKFSVIRIERFRDFEKGKTSFRYILDDLADAISGKSFDVIHVHNFMPGLAFAAISSLVKAKKTIFTFHSTPIPEEGKIIGHFSDYRVEKSFASFIINLLFYDILVCPSRYYYDWALELGADKEKLKLVYHGIDEKNFITRKDATWRSTYGYTADDFIVVCPARMIQRKGILELVKAIQILNDKKIKLFIPTSVQNGSVEYFALVNDFVQTNNLSERVKIVADKENLESMPQVFANSDVCVLPSHIKGLGIVLLEGMAAGVPVIGSNTFGINEVIEDGINGLLSEPKNPMDLAEKISRIKKEKELSAILIRGGKNSVRLKFSLAKQLELLELIYQ